MQCETATVVDSDIISDVNPAAATSASSSATQQSSSSSRYHCEPIFMPDWRVQTLTRLGELYRPSRQELVTEEFIRMRRPPPGPPCTRKPEYMASPLRRETGHEVPSVPYVSDNHQAPEDGDLLRRTLDFENALRSRLHSSEPRANGTTGTVAGFKAPVTFSVEPLLPSEPSRAAHGSQQEEDVFIPFCHQSAETTSSPRRREPSAGNARAFWAAAARAGRAASRGREVLTSLTAKERGKSPARQDVTAEVLLGPALHRNQPEEAEAGAENSEGEGFENSLPKGPRCPQRLRGRNEVRPEHAPIEVSTAEASARIVNETAQLKRELERQIEQRKALQKSMASERAKSDALSRQNQELMQAAEERLKSQQRISCAETSELSDQVDALLMIKRQLYRRIQELEAERTVMINDREAAMGDRACVVCMDRVANTVLLRCKHLVCCEDCSAHLSHCPVCRQPVRDRLPVFVL